MENKKMNSKELIERKQYMQTLRNLKDHNIIKVITGVRRCGKSTLLQMFADELLQKGITPEQIQFYNFEDPDVYTIGSWKDIYDYIKVQLLPDKMNYIFLDEVQNIDVFQRLVDGLFIKKNVDLYITGSNAYLLSGELATLLTGRYIETKILPYSYQEYVQFLTMHSPKSESVGSFAEIRNPQNFPKSESFADFVYNGGIPEAYKLLIEDAEQADIFIESVLNTIIEKDIFERNKIYNKAVFNKVIDFVFDSVGSYISANSITKTLKGMGVKTNNETVMNYLSYLNDAMLLYTVPRFDIKGKGLLQTLNKHYLSDVAFRRVRLGKMAGQDMGHLLENAVYLELRRRYRQVYVGKFREMEVDFVATDHEGYTSYYQVAWTTMNSPETLERELASLNAIKNANPKYLLTTDMDFNPVYNGIRKLNVADWMFSNS
jgi:predicted AAA+ superfamily ATPase